MISGLGESSRASRSLHINVLLLRKLRRKRGWTQRDLAEKSGYSERLIRKAEHGGTLDIETIRNLAESLSTEDDPISFEELASDQLSIAKLWVDALNHFGVGMIPVVAPYLSDKFVFNCPGDPSTAPFIGMWEGLEGFKQHVDAYFQVFRRVPNDNVTFTIGENLVSARWQESGYLGDELVGPVRINMHFHFRDGKICRIDDEYDVQGGAYLRSQAELALSSRKTHHDEAIA